MKIYMNGKLVDEKDAKVSVFDHGLLYGDGVFEGIRIYNRRVFMLDEHIDRLYRSALAISLAIPITKKQMEAGRDCHMQGEQDHERIHPADRDPRRRHSRTESVYL